MKNLGIQLNGNSDGVQNIDLKIEVKRNADGLITQGLIVGEIMAQTQALILISNPGEFKFSPTIGVAIDELILDNDYLRFRHRIRDHLQKAGMQVRSVQFEDNKPLIICADYE